MILNYGINSWLSGRGKSPKADMTNRGQFVVDFIKEASLGQPVLVSPSMSGSYSLPFLMGPGGSTCQDRLMAYVPIAPGSSDTVTADEYKKCKVSHTSGLIIQPISISHSFSICYSQSFRICIHWLQLDMAQN